MTIKEVSELTGLTSYTLRYYEKEGILQEIKRDDSGYRKYSQKDIDILRFLNCLKKAEMSVKEIKEFASLLYRGESTVEARIDLLQKQEAKVKIMLHDIQEAYNHINWKITYYKEQLLTQEN